MSDIGEKCSWLLSWNEQQIVIREGGFSKEYPWSRVHRVEVLPVYPLVRLVASELNGSEREFVLGGSIERGEAFTPEWALLLGRHTELGEHFESFLLACEKVDSVEVTRGGWHGEPALGWESVQGLPVERAQRSGSAYRTAARSRDPILHRWAISGLAHALFRVPVIGTVLQGIARSRQAHLPTVGALYFPEEVVVTESFVYARLGTRSFRASRESFRLRHDMLALEHGEPFVVSWLFGRSGRLVFPKLKKAEREALHESIGATAVRSDLVQKVCGLP